MVIPSYYIVYDSLTNNRTSPSGTENEQVITKFNPAEHILQITNKTLYCTCMFDMLILYYFNSNLRL